MVKNPLFKQTFSLLVFIGVADFFANTLYLYWTVWWFDMVMHFSSGFCIGMAGVLFWQHYFDKNIHFEKAIKISLYFAFLIGILWEVFEWYFQVMLTIDRISYITDTISDLILDVVGGILGSIYAHKIIFKR